MLALEEIVSLFRCFNSWLLLLLLVLVLSLDVGESLGGGESSWAVFWSVFENIGGGSYFDNNRRIR